MVKTNLRNKFHWNLNSLRPGNICVSNLTIIGSDNGLSPGRRQAIIGTSAGILLIVPQGTNFSAILIKIHTFSFKKMYLKMSAILSQLPFCLGLNVLLSGNWRPFYLGLNVLTIQHHVRQWPGVGVTKALFVKLRSLISPQANFSILPKYLLDYLHHIHIWQVSPQLSCGNTCQIWTWYTIANMYFGDAEKLGI